jgi:predicted RNA-binding protein YlxR (DUF448 family)
VPKTGKRRRKHKPQRTCVGCRTVQEKRGLIRIVRSPEGVKVDLLGKLAGRGAYLHDRPSCWELGLNGRLAHALKTTLSESEMQTLKAFSESLSPAKDS